MTSYSKAAAAPLPAVRMPGKLPLFGWFFGLICFLELGIRLFVFTDRVLAFYPLAFALPAAALFTLLCGFGSEKAARRMALFLTLLTTVYYGTQLVYYYIFKNFLSIYSVQMGLGQVLQFWPTALRGILVNLPGLCLFLLPTLLYLLLLRRQIRFPTRDWRRQGTLALGGALSYAALLVLLCAQGQAMFSPYDLYFVGDAGINLKVDKLGVLTALTVDLRQMGEDAEETMLELDTESDPLLSGEPLPPSDPVAQPEETPPEEEAGGDGDPLPRPNALPIDFDALERAADDPELAKLHRYFAELDPTMQNDYTGMFEGYNLIFLTAESFSPYVIDPERTPTLHRMATEGFRFQNFYNPVWGVSTSDGEYAALTSLIPKSGVWSMYQSSGNDMRFTLGNLLSEAGYATFAYHNNTGRYYRRDVSHPNLGYTFKAPGMGLDITPTWPQSDLEMIEQSLPDFVGDAPFHIYYMTVSGHMLYTFADNAMATRHREAVEDLPLSEEARAYLACNIELDRALERLIEALDASGELERTLFVVSPDHYPYGLEKSTLDELAGHEVDPNFEIYKSSLLIWSAAMEEPVVVDKLCSSLDILPTVLNLMGIDYDSRLLIGRDILSDAPALVIFADSSFISDACFYQATTQMVTPRIAGPIDWGYVNEILTAIANKFRVSAAVLDLDYYASLPDPLPDP